MECELFPAEKIKNLLNNYLKENIKISSHYEEHLNKGKRDLSQEQIREYLIEKEPHFVEKQIIEDEIRYKIVYKLSSKYDLVIVVTEVPQALKVITAYKTSKKVKETWNKKSKLAMRK